MAILSEDRGIINKNTQGFFSIKQQFELMSRFYLSARAVEAGSSCSDMVIQCLFSYSTILHSLPNYCYRMAHISHGPVSSMHTWHIDDVLERAPCKEQAESQHSHMQLPPERQVISLGVVLYILTSLQLLQQKDMSLLKALGEISQNIINETNACVRASELSSSCLMPAWSYKTLPDSSFHMYNIC